MQHTSQGTRKLNSTEVILPPEASQKGNTGLPVALPASPMDYPVDRFSQALERREDNRKALLKWIQSNLQAGIDYGQIHVMGKDKCRLAKEGRANECMDPRHWSKPSLWKPGAEKICGMLGLITRFPNLHEYENAVLRGEDIKVIILKCHLESGNGFVAAEGTGARRVAQDNGDINKALKMAEKSAHIDATLRVAGISEIFTQDLEDMANGTGEDVPPDFKGQAPTHQNHSQGKHRSSAGGNDQYRGSHRPARNGSANRRQSGGYNNSPENLRQDNHQGNGGSRITGKQYKFIMDLLKNAGMTKKELNAHCMETYGSVVDHITRADASSLIDWLQSR